MTTNQIVVRDILGVVAAIAAVTAIALVLASRHASPQRAPEAAHAAEARAPPRGAEVFERKGCVACHSVDGSARVGPSLLHDFGSTVELDDGRRVAMDEAYIRESVLSPRAASRPGYPPSMPSFDGLIKPQELDALVAYIASLR